MKTVAQNEIKQALNQVGLSSINAIMLSRCTTFANNHRISPKALAECWEAFSLNKSTTELSENSWKAFRNELVKEAENNGPTPMEVESGAVKVEPGMGKRQVGGLPLVTPPAKRVAKGGMPDQVTSAVDAVAVSSSPSAPAYTPPKYEERSGVGRTVLEYNPNDLKPMVAAASQSKHAKCGITYNQFDTNVPERYRHLFTTMEDRAKALDQHMVRLEDVLMERYHIGKETNDNNDQGKDESAIAPLEAVATPRQEKICCIGRICNAAHEGRINATSVVLEGSKHMGGARIELDLSQLQEEHVDFSLFPGQIVAVEGMNSTGRKMTAHRICEGAAPGTLKTTAKQLLKYHHDEQHQNGAPIKLMSVAGPYTTSDNLSFSPLYDFMSQVAQEQPDVVVMVGPFVDLRHKDIQGGNSTFKMESGEGLAVPFETLFLLHVSSALQEYCEDNPDVKTQFVLVPSLDDATADWVYPQAPFQDEVFGTPGKVWDLTKDLGVDTGVMGLEGINAGGSKRSRRVHCVSNPCTFQVNETVIGVTGTDTIFHMSADECNGNLVPGSRLARISQHMLQQQSYYPLFPPAIGTNLDLKRMQQWNMPCQPDLLIVPSKLTSFARTVLEDTVVVNPGQLSKNTTGGTFSIMEIHPMKREDLENAGDDVELAHNIPERLRVEIKKI